ncbi:MAG: TonB-dependent receptor plug domain-containing protein, partial [Gemmatimonadota bacterium]|nr:TonB-dependent receptor plug domain-containing protein [Gemmatimonadota bacterium]
MVHVTDAGTTAPVDQAQVSLVGTTLGGITNSDGRVTVRGVKPGTHQIRVLRVGYAEQKKAVVVTAGADASVEFSLSTAAFTLAPTVSTATGETRRVELGNSIAQIDAAKVAETSPISNVADMLNSRAPGVSVISGTQTGTGQRVRIRGTNSLSLTNEPIYVIDGIRMTSTASSIAFGSGGNNPSRVGDIDPAEIENIEIVKGPSAATLYGTDAANGVIVITTKRGRAGKTRINAFVENGLIKDRNT